MELKAGLVAAIVTFSSCCILASYLANQASLKQHWEEPTGKTDGPVASEVIKDGSTDDEATSSNIVSAKQARKNSSEDFVGQVVIKYENVTENVDERSPILFYNRVPKCGSRSLTVILKNLESVNRFKLILSHDYSDKVTPERRKEVIYKVAHLSPRTVYQEHIHFVNFREYGYKQPLYINLIRDPMERFVSMYNYRKFGGADESGQIPGYAEQYDINECILESRRECSYPRVTFVIGRYFCGYSEVCRAITKESIALAKEHLMEDYAIVGLTEEFENSLRLFEILLPQYFTGATGAWNKNSSTIKVKTSSHKRENLNSDAAKKLKKKLAGEYEIYNFARKKFYELKEKYL